MEEKPGNSKDRQHQDDGISDAKGQASAWLSSSGRSRQHNIAQKYRILIPSQWRNPQDYDLSTIDESWKVRRALLLAEIFKV